MSHHHHTCVALLCARQCVLSVTSLSHMCHIICTPVSCLSRHHHTCVTSSSHMCHIIIRTHGSRHHMHGSVLPVTSLSHMCHIIITHVSHHHTQIGGLPKRHGRAERHDFASSSTICHIILRKYIHTCVDTLCVCVYAHIYICTYVQKNNHRRTYLTSSYALTKKKNRRASKKKWPRKRRDLARPPPQKSLAAV